MLKYLVVILDKSSVSYCHYPDKKESGLISLENLREGVMFAMKHDLKIQYVLPKFTLPQEYLDVMNSMFHDNIGPVEQKDLVDIVVIDGLDELQKTKEILNSAKRCIVRMKVNDFLNQSQIVKDTLSEGISVNVVFTDVEVFDDGLIDRYNYVLEDLRCHVKKLLFEGCNVNTNLLTDRIALDEMNNCGAGDTTVTLAPDGKFYPCPGFYTTKELGGESGEIGNGLKILNQRLFTLDCAPLCKRCDAYHCKRCVWLNKKLTCEINIPSRQQCVMSHLERNASRALLEDFHKDNVLMEKNIEKIDYLDPFDEYQSV